VLSWHCDIKPENILLATMPDSKEWCFKLADPGFSNFLLKEEWKGQPSDLPHRKVEGGTAAFGKINQGKFKVISGLTSYSPTRALFLTR
jgi:serine/threonine protein kinase